MATPPSPSNHAATSKEEEIQKIGSELERLTMICINAINVRDWEYTSPEGQEFLRHIHPTFTAVFDNVPGKLDWQGLNTAWRSMFTAHPKGQFNVTRMSTGVDDQAGHGDVIIESEATGLIDGVLHGMSEAKWRRINGKWWFFYHGSARGSKGNSGFV